MGFLSDYVYYNSGDECPEQFWRWSGLSLFGAVLGRKVWYNHGKFPISPQTYVALIGSPGSGKSTARLEAKRMFVENFPTFLHSASVQSREDIIKKMATPECLRTWTNPITKKPEEFRPFYIIANEISSFVSVDKGKMVDFLVDVFDENWYSTGFKNSESQDFKNPCVSVLACGVPEWFMSNLKADLFAGGLGRRLIIVYGQKKRRIAFPNSPDDFLVVRQRCVDHLKEAGAAAFCGEIKATHVAKTWWKDWYENPKNFSTDDPILKQFFETMHIQLIKVAIMLALDERPFRMEITDAHFNTARAMIELNYPDIIRLTAGTGRNELAGVGAQLMEVLRLQDGIGFEKRLHAQFFRHVRDGEWMEILKVLSTTDQLMIYRSPVAPFKVLLVTPERYPRFCEELKGNGNGATAPSEPASSSSSPA